MFGAICDAAAAVVSAVCGDDELSDCEDSDYEPFGSDDDDCNDVDDVDHDLTCPRAIWPVRYFSAQAARASETGRQPGRLRDRPRGKKSR